MKTRCRIFKLLNLIFALPKIKMFSRLPEVLAADRCALPYFNNNKSANPGEESRKKIPAPGTGTGI